jgi:hypothetical protein
MTPVRIDQALLDRNLLGAGLDPATWGAWITVMRAAAGIELDAEETAFFKSVAGDREAPRAPVAETWIIVGRRSGKSRVAAAKAVHAATLCQHRLSPGERGTILVLAATMGQASTVLGYCLGFLEASPFLRQQIESRTANEIRLEGGVTIAVHPANFRSVRGRTILAAIFDEVAFWRGDDDGSSNPDKEVLRAVQPALAASGGELTCISSPYRRTGVLFERHRSFFGANDPRILVIQGASKIFNPTLSQASIDQAHADDPESASSEWDGLFRADISSFLDDDLINAAIDTARPRELPPIKGKSYVAYADASGGRVDAYTICIGHKEPDGRFVADVVRGVAPPFNPADVTRQFAELVHEYGCRKVVSDNYSAEWVSAAWREAGLMHERSPQTASELYVEALPSFARNAISIPDVAPLIRELRQLERRVSRMGRDQVSHGPGGHDDHANALVGALRQAVRPPNTASTGALIGCEAGTFSSPGARAWLRDEMMRRQSPPMAYRPINTILPGLPKSMRGPL